MQWIIEVLFTNQSNALACSILHFSIVAPLHGRLIHLFQCYHSVCVPFYGYMMQV
jgi:hypothetical protein